MMSATEPVIQFAERRERPLAVRVREACRLTGIGRSKLYELIAQGELEIIKVGSITLISMTTLERFLEGRRSG